MASNAYNDYLVALLQDAEEVLAAHSKLTTGKQGRQWGVASLNRAAVVMCVGAWEAYIKAVIKESVSLMRPDGERSGMWAVLKAQTDGFLGNFNTPNAENVQKTVACYVGLQDVTSFWYWANFSRKQATARLNQLMKSRHKIAHGAKPQPKISNSRADSLPRFFRNLARRTDKAIQGYLSQDLGLTVPW